MDFSYRKLHVPNASNFFTHAASERPTLAISTFNCEELSSCVQNLKETKRSKKDKLSCILNLLKSALSEEIDNFGSQETIEDLIYHEDILEDEINDYANAVAEKRGGEINCAEKTFGQLVAIIEDKTKDCVNNAEVKNLEVPTMIPIFKPRHAIRNDFLPANPVLKSIPVSQAVNANANLKSKVSEFIIPCQRAADILDMSIQPSPREIIEKKAERILQPNLKPNTPALSSISENQIQTKVFVHSANSEESLSIHFKPREISLFQLYGNLLKKITITVLIPYHMSKIGLG